MRRYWAGTSWYRSWTKVSHRGFMGTSKFVFKDAYLKLLLGINRSETERRVPSRGAATLRDTCWPLSRHWVPRIEERWTLPIAADTIKIVLYLTGFTSVVLGAGRLAAPSGPTQVGLIFTQDLSLLFFLLQSMQVTLPRAAEWLG